MTYYGFTVHSLRTARYLSAEVQQSSQLFTEVMFRVRDGRLEGEHYPELLEFRAQIRGDELLDLFRTCFTEPLEQHKDLAKIVPRIEPRGLYEVFTWEL